MDRIYKKSISKEKNNDDLNLQSMPKLSGWLRYCPDDDCILVETLILNHNEIIRSFHYFVSGTTLAVWGRK